MTYFKRYFTYRIKASAFGTVTMTLIASIIAFVIVSTESARKIGSGMDYYNSGIECLAWIMFIAAVVIPIIEIYAFKSRRSLDFLMPMPIKRHEMVICHYFTGIIQLITATAIPTVTVFLQLLLSGKGFHVVWIIPYYFTLLGIGLCFYSVAVFLFSQGNTVGDGIVFTLGCPTALAVVTVHISEMLNSYSYLNYRINEKSEFLSNLDELANVFDMMSIPQYYYSSVVEGHFSRSERYLPNTFEIYRYLFWAVIAVACAVGFVVWMSRYRTEKAGDISDSFFGYRTLIPVIGLTIIRMCGKSIDVLTFTVIIAVMAVAYFIYRRSFRIKLADIAVLGFAFVACMI